jgi:hypothetical protein
MSSAKLLLAVVALYLLCFLSCGKRVKTGQIFKTVTIGNQVWMAENLNVSTFRNGDPIPEVKTDKEWERAGENGKPAWCYYDNELEIYLGMSQSDADGYELLRGTDEGGKLKETETTHWKSPNTGATDESGFSALPGGFRYLLNVDFGDMGNNAIFWSSSEINRHSAWYRSLSFNYSGVTRYIYNKQSGFSVRCVRDN